MPSKIKFHSMEVFLKKRLHKMDWKASTSDANGPPSRSDGEHG